MRFQFIDRIDELEPGQRIRAVKALAMSEDYLADHFPRFPVMPGVLMVEALTQASQWLVRASDAFSHSMVVLEAVRAVKFSDFVTPGSVLHVEATLGKREGLVTQLRASGSVSGRPAVSARLTLASSNLADVMPGRETTDTRIIRKAKDRFRLLFRGDAEQFYQDVDRAKPSIAS